MAINTPLLINVLAPVNIVLTVAFYWFLGREGMTRRAGALAALVWALCLTLIVLCLWEGRG